ncbi:uncharacterized protein, partial [Panulirus ornatus]|uniref:uncharacterized protein n=1 Tax=Panulirus ornatus TaxID=150431 RepID=UPI003A884BFD
FGDGGQLEAIKVCGSGSLADGGGGTSFRCIPLPPYSPRPPSFRRHSLPTPVHAFFTAFSCPALTQLQAIRHSNIRIAPENVWAKANIRGSLRKYRKRLNSTSNPQLSQTIHIKDTDTDNLFSEMLSQRCSHYEERPTSAPPGDSLQISPRVSFNSAHTSATQSLSLENRESEKKLGTFHLDTLDVGCESKSNGSVYEFMSLDEYEAPYLEESVYRISEFCAQDEMNRNSDLDSNTEQGTEDLIDTLNSYRSHRKSQIYGYTDSVDDSTTLPPIYELECEGSDVTELTSPPKSVEYWSLENLVEKSECITQKCGDGTFEIDQLHKFRNQNSCAQYCSDNDSIMSYYSIIPPEGLRESIRNVDHLVGKLDGINVQGCPSPISPFPFTPPNTCDSSPKLINVRHPARNNLHALSGVEVK